MYWRTTNIFSGMWLKTIENINSYQEVRREGLWLLANGCRCIGGQLRPRAATTHAFEHGSRAEVPVVVVDQSSPRVVQRPQQQRVQHPQGQVHCQQQHQEEVAVEHWEARKKSTRVPARTSRLLALPPLMQVRPLTAHALRLRAEQPEIWSVIIFDLTSGN